MTNLDSAPAHIAAPVIHALLEDLHTAASAEITRIEAAMPPRIDAAETSVQDWATDLLGTLHGLVARIDSARTNVTTATVPTPAPAPAAKPQA